MKINKNFWKIRPGSFSGTVFGLAGFLIIALSVFLWEIYIPKNPGSNETFTYVVQKGVGDEEVSTDLAAQGIIKSKYFFRLYTIFSFQDYRIQAGTYSLSPGDSLYKIVKKFVKGDVVKNKITILEGWNIKDIAVYFEEKEICSALAFIHLAYQDFSGKYGFLKEKPKDISLEGYLFPDTYEVSERDSAEDVVKSMLSNFERKITPEIKEEIVKQKKTLFDIVVVASLIEKEARKLDDKKKVSGIIWKRLEAGMPLQLDATINYITNKNNPSSSLSDLTIDSPYNTYKYAGLPAGPISNPGMDSIMAALYPTETEYWYYLSSKSGAMIFSKNYIDHKSAITNYLRY